MAICTHWIFVRCSGVVREGGKNLYRWCIFKKKTKIDQIKRKKKGKKKKVRSVTRKFNFEERLTRPVKEGEARNIIKVSVKERSK